nr:MAG TPA: hypothetical protein [Caudoviricetes sp.]
MIFYMKLIGKTWKLLILLSTNGIYINSVYLIKNTLLCVVTYRMMLMLNIFSCYS